MTSAARIDRDDVLEALRPDAVIAHFGVKGRRFGREFRTRTCPACGERSRADAVAINLVTGKWHDHAHGCSGDLFALLAGLAGLDVRKQFREVIDLGAEIAGVTPAIAPMSASERAQRREDIARRAAQREAQELEETERRRQQAIEFATAQWGRLSTSSKQGEEYVSRRGVAGVLDLGLVRFDSGAVAVPLFSADGQVVNVVRRRIEGGEPKIVGLRDCPTAGTFVGSLADITHGRDAVITEGLFDSLTARLAWPDAVVLGAHGAGNVPKIAAAAVPRIKLARSRLLLVPHDDVAGAAAMTAAGRLALAAGLQLHKDLLVLDDIAEPDLNDAWCAGWRPR